MPPWSYFGRGQPPVLSIPPSIITVMSRSPIEQPRSIEQAVVQPINDRLEDIANNRAIGNGEMEMERKHDMAVPAEEGVVPEFKIGNTGQILVKNPTTKRWIDYHGSVHKLLIRGGKVKDVPIPAELLQSSSSSSSSSSTPM